jgi:hypothetical protein
MPARYKAWTCTWTCHGYGFGATGIGSMWVFWEYHTKHAKYPKFQVFVVAFNL